VPGGSLDDEIPEPQIGLNSEFDEANVRVDQIKQLLEDELKKIRGLLKDKRVVFSHAKYRYELEVPEDLVKGKKKPDDFEFTS
jgi:DNA mismatch repair protein MSH6